MSDPDEMDEAQPDEQHDDTGSYGSHDMLSGGDAGGQDYDHTGYEGGVAAGDGDGDGDAAGSPGAGINDMGDGDGASGEQHDSNASGDAGADAFGDADDGAGVPSMPLLPPLPSDGNNAKASMASTSRRAGSGGAGSYARAGSGSGSRGAGSSFLGNPYGDDYALVRGETILDAMEQQGGGRALLDMDDDIRGSGGSLHDGINAGIGAGVAAVPGSSPSRQARNTVDGDDLAILQDDGEEDEEEDTAVMDASHPLMKRVQDAISVQLKKHMQKLELEIREKEEMCRKETKHREEAGVELYTLQQQLARLQAMLEGSEDNFAIIRGLREEADRNLKHTSAEYKREQEKLQQHTKNLDQHKLELEKISRTLKQVDLYNEELRSRILVAKRTTLKAEEDIIKQEMEKRRQDYFIDHLTEQLRRLQERRAIYETQLQAQQRETKAAVETLQDAATEMEAIQFEKRQLLNQWKSSLIGLQRRDDVLLQIEKAIEKNNEALASMNREIGGFRRAHHRAQEEGETLTMILNKLENEIDYLKRQIGTINDQKDKLKETYAMYMKSLNQAEQELNQLQQASAVCGDLLSMPWFRQMG
ncbi:hypothetical protein BC831DRAFT_77433 [Entophlyctis helioformis]|nr:hypothetical protein BC831DRAFT_77433 [Entophlyctis helioformis]